VHPSSPFSNTKGGKKGSSNVRTRLRAYISTYILDALFGHIIQFNSPDAHTPLSALSTVLPIPSTQRLEYTQLLTRPSPGILRLLKYHANPLHRHRQPNLRIQHHDRPPGSPRTHRARRGVQGERLAVRIAHRARGRQHRGRLSMMTNGLLKSALHRVGTVPGREMPERYNIAYLMRPED